MADPFDGMLGTGTYLIRVGWVVCFVVLVFCVFYFLQTLLSEKKRIVLD